MQQLTQQEPETRGLSQEEYREVVRRAELIRADREGRLSREALRESAAEVGIQEQDLEEAERQLRAEQVLRTQRQARTRLIAAVTAAVLALLLLFSYGSLNGSRLAALEAKSNLQTTLQRRADLVPQLAQVTREGARHEPDLVDRLTRARSGLQSGDLATQLNANQELNRIVVESTPQFRGTGLYQGLTDEIAGTENRISVARQRYNEAATRYNGTASSFPAGLVRPLLGFPKEIPLFVPRGNVEEPPRL